MRAQDILAARSRRARLFPHMNEATWLILVDLFANDGRGVSVTSACLASYAPATTALRYIGLLEASGLVWRDPHPRDRRSTRLRLTALARARLAEFFLDPLHHGTGKNPDALAITAPGGVSVPFHAAGDTP